MAHRLRACTALSEYPSSVLNTHIWWLKTTFNFSSRGSDSAGVSGNLHSCAHTHITEQGTEKHNILQDMYSGLHNYWWTLNKSVCIRYLVFIDFHDMRSLHPTLKLWYKAFFVKFSVLQNIGSLCLHPRMCEFICLESEFPIVDCFLMLVKPLCGD